MSRTAKLTVALVALVLIAAAASAYFGLVRSTEQTVEVTAAAVHRTTGRRSGIQ